MIGELAALKGVGDLHLHLRVSILTTCNYIVDTR